MTNQLEIKIAEFNYKLMNKILPTVYNLFKWKKAPDGSCIYCREKCHDTVTMSPLEQFVDYC